MIFMKFEQWGMGLCMFWWSNNGHLWNNEDLWQKNRHFHFKYWNSLDSNHMAKITMEYLSREFQYLKWWFSSHGSSLLYVQGVPKKNSALACCYSRANALFFGTPCMYIKFKIAILEKAIALLIYNHIIKRLRRSSFRFHFFRLIVSTL